LFAAGGLLAARLGRAQPAKLEGIRTVGYLSFGVRDPKVAPSEYFTTKALAKRGWIEGKNLVVERLFAEHKAERVAGLAEELVRKRVELIITVEDAPAIAAARATRTIPIVFINMAFPVERGLVDSLARPGRNVTGSTWLHSPGEVIAKRVELLREIAPAAKRLFSLTPAVHFDRVDGGKHDSSPAIVAEAKRLGFELRTHIVHKIEDVEVGLAEALAWNAQALLGAGALVEAARERVAEFTLRHRLPSAFLRPLNVEAGGLLSYGTTLTEYLALIERGMEHVDRILRGANPAELPVAQPRVYELVINLKTAKALALTIPQSMLVRAGRLIE
jgi:putative ABC transport system substrate-binding protein